MKQPVIIVVSLMRLEGTTGVQAHMRDFVGYLAGKGVPYEVATPFHWLTAPLLAVFIGLRKLLERTWKPAAVALYRGGHAALLYLRLRYLMSRHPDCVVYAQCPMSASVALRCQRHATQRVALVVHFNVSQADEWIGKGMMKAGSWLDRHIRRIELGVVQRVQGLVCVSAFMREEVAKVWPGMDAANVAIIPNFVYSLASMQPKADMVGRDLVCIGTLEPRKNQGFLLEVLAEVRGRGRELSLTLVGDGPDRGTLTRRAQELGLANQVHFEGFSPQGRLYIPGHRLYVHAALMENLPVVLLEALSAGVPVLAARVGGIPEIFEDGVQGRFWPLDDVQRASDVLMALLDDPSGLADMSKAALQRFEDRFEVEAVAGRLHDYLRGLPAASPR